MKLDNPLESWTSGGVTRLSLHRDSSHILLPRLSSMIENGFVDHLMVLLSILQQAEGRMASNGENILADDMESSDSLSLREIARSIMPIYVIGVSISCLWFVCELCDFHKELNSRERRTHLARRGDWMIKNRSE